MIIPDNLTPGDSVAIVSPASIVNPDYIDGAAHFLESEGLRPVVMPHANGPASGSFAATDAERLADLLDAWREPTVRAILCSRGGYGCNHLLPLIPVDTVRDNPKWLIGFSDISALHALSLRAGVVSMHAPMAKHLTLLPSDHYCTRAIMRMLTEGLPVEYIVPGHPLNRPGEAEGMLVGGNLAVINGLGATQFDPVARATEQPVILFIEDISEAIYAVERMLIRLRLAGQLDRVAGLIVGAFTEYRADRNHPDMETMISRLLGDVPFPVAYGFPAGHTDDNLPLALGAHVRLAISPETTILTIDAE